MSTYLVRLTPQEPYFFGNEKCLTFNDGNPRGQMSNRYYIKSERTPLQTTLLGAMRYIILPEKKYNYAEKEKYIGKDSFKIEESSQSFGIIKRISPLFLLKGNERLVVTPFNHIKTQKKEETIADSKINIKYKKLIYTPFANYQKILTADKEKWYTPDFNVKEGLTDSYVYVDDDNFKKIVDSDDIFSYTTRVMINKTQDRKAFFKKDYVTLAKDYSFGFYMELSDNTIIDKSQLFVYLGQGKSLFSLQFDEAENDIEDRIKTLISDNTAYCFGDTLTDNSIYETAKFAVVDFRDYRAYETLTDGEVKKGNRLYKLIKAGSVFISDNISTINCSHKNCEQIGFNIIVKK